MDERRGAILMTVAMTIAGTVGWFVLASGQPVVDVVFWRCAFGAMALGGACWRLEYLRRGLSRRELLGAIAGGAAIVSNWLFLFAAYPRSSIAVATTVYNVQPFILLGLGAAFLGERVTAAKLTWLALAFVGLLLVVQLGAKDLDPTYLSGIAMALAAAFFWAVATLLTKRLAGTPPHLIALVHVCVGMIALAPLAQWGHPPHGLAAWSSLATIGIIHTAVVNSLLYEAVQKLPTHLQGALAFIYPIVAILVDVLALGNCLFAPQVVGIAIILLAAAGMGGLFAPVFARLQLAIKRGVTSRPRASVDSEPGE